VIPGQDTWYVILDASALVAAGRGNRFASELITRAHTRPSDGAPVVLYTTSCALVSADRERPGTGTHLAALPDVTVLPLDLPAALHIMADEGWSLPHTRYAAQPSLDLPEGAVVATVHPQAWRGQPVRVLDISPDPEP
jgi:hypothetical protein